MGFWRGEWQRFLDFRPVERAFFWILVVIHLLLWGWQWYQNRLYEMEEPVSVVWYEMVRREHLPPKKVDLAKAYNNVTDENVEHSTMSVLSGPDSGSNRAIRTSEGHGFRLFHFDPNTVSEDSLLLLGVPLYAVRNWVRYREAGGTFYRAKDILKIYGMDTATYDRIRPYVRIALPRKKEARKEVRVIDINTADTADWMQLPGIGKVFSRRILRFREALGGFYSVAQVAETYGLPDSTFEKIKPYLRCTPRVRQLNLNTAREDQLARHPYINKREARLIVRYRHQNGPFRDVAELKELYGLDTVRMKRYLPYLCVQCSQ